MKKKTPKKTQSKKSKPKSKKPQLRSRQKPQSKSRSCAASEAGKKDESPVCSSCPMVEIKEPQVVVRTQWTTVDNAVEDGKSDNSQLILKNIEYMLERGNLLDAYKDAVEAAGGDTCSWGDKLKIAGYVYFGGITKENSRIPFVKKPMSLLRESEKVDEIRSIGVKSWGDVKIRPVRRPLITEQDYKEWRNNLYPAPNETIKGAKQFKELCLDDRIKWAHNYISKYHSLLAKSEPIDAAVLKAMEASCKQSGIPVFVGKDRDVKTIEFLVDEYTGLTPLAGLLDVIQGIEDSKPDKYVKYDAKTKDVNYIQALKLLMPTLKTMGLMDLYKEYSTTVKSFKDKGRIFERVDGEHNIEIAKYLIICGRWGTNMGSITGIPQCLMEAMDPQITDHVNDEMKEAVKKGYTSVDDMHASEQFGYDLNRTRKIAPAASLPPGWGTMGVKAHRMAGEKVNQRIDVMVDGKTWGTAFSPLFKDEVASEYYANLEKKAANLIDSKKIIDITTVRKVIIVPDKSINFVGCKKKS